MIELKDEAEDRKAQQARSYYLKSKMKKMWKECEKEVEYEFEDGITVVFKEEQE